MVKHFKSNLLVVKMAEDFSWETSLTFETRAIVLYGAIKDQYYGQQVGTKLARLLSDKKYV